MTPEDRFLDWLPEGLKAAALREPSAGALRRAVALGTQLGRKAPVWLAHRLFDSSAEPLAAGVRRATAADRRLLYQIRGAGADADEARHQLDLQLKLGADDRIELTGQLMPPWPGAVVRVASGRRKQSQPLGPAGEFLFRRADSGLRPITLSIETEDGPAIVLAGLGIDPEEPEGA